MSFNRNPKMPPGTPTLCLGLTLGLSLAACGGGGGSGEGGGGGSGNPFVTAEFRANYGLANIRAANAYEAGWEGTGQTIAVIDTGVDVDHPDLDGKILPQSTDIAAGNGTTLNDTFGHGTLVAGVALAERNGVGMHGVAWGADLLAIRADALNPCDPFSACFQDDDLAAALNYARTQGARIVNMSLGGGGIPNANFRSALLAATNAGIIVVIAAGNASGANPEYPARFAADPAYSGLVVAVGAVNDANAIAGFSNRAGVASANYIVAPGVSITTTSNTGGYASANGTSFSAPHVAGAVAVLRERFPTATAAEIVEMLLSTARDLGADGTDAVYGRGLLSLSDALAPLGFLWVPVDLGALVEETELRLGAAFGDGLTQSAALANVLALDMLGRDFHIDMRGAVLPARDVRASAFEGAVLRSADRAVASRIGDFGHWGLSFTDSARLPATLAEPHGEDRSLRSWWMQSGTEHTQTGLYYGAAAGRGAPSILAPIGFASRLTLPQFTLAGTGSGAFLSQEMGKTARLSFAWHRGDGSDPSAATSLGQAWLEANVGRVQLALGLGQADEEASLFRSTAAGGFGTFASTRSQFVTLGGAMPITTGVSAFASLTTGLARPDMENGMLSGWSDVRAASYNVGVRWQDVLTRGDRVGLAFGQPLRVEQAEVDVTVPTALRADGSVPSTTRRIDATPSGREMTVELAYDRAVGQAASLATFVSVAREPGHDRDAAPAAFGGVRFSLGF